MADHSGPRSETLFSRIRAHAINDRAQFLFEDPGQNPPKKHIRRFSSRAA
jgi:hypothetical protein